MRAPVRAEINAGPLGRGAGCALRQPGCPFELPRYVAGRAGPARLLWLAWLVGQSGWSASQHQPGWSD